MKITPAGIGAALVVTVGIVAVSASVLITSLSQGSALVIGSMAGSVRLAGDMRLTSDLKRLPAADRATALFQHGLSSEAALAARLEDTRQRLDGYADRQAHVRIMANYSSGFLYAALLALAIISLKVAMMLISKPPTSRDDVHA